ncbi:MAG: Uma2 family endonuclease [Aphanothece sp. CMT-3BRIN-NPC111]|jgi:Uma2 family endonuclease|nr:Uma2 family endonuclease [Aphanothece sp. CMT-3BRIN-NPC111]
MNAQLLDKPASESVQESYVVLHDVSWEKFEAIDLALEGTGARLTYLDGTLEIMSPLSEEHEESKRTIGMLLEAYLREKGIRFYARGSATLGKREEGARREPDESYNLEIKKTIPDIAIEVVITSGGIDKLQFYKRIRVPEVWFWQNRKLAIYHLRESGEYEAIAQSTLLPNLDLDLLVSCANMPDQYDAVTEFLNQICDK